jgi:hypothetical protein
MYHTVRWKLFAIVQWWLGRRTSQNIAEPVLWWVLEFGTAETFASILLIAFVVRVAAGKPSTSASALFELSNTLFTPCCKCQVPVEGKCFL